MSEITKDFTGVRALSGVNLHIEPGTIHCIVGENGAGKSTLMKILSGAYSPSKGTLIIDGVEYSSLSPQQSKSLGIRIVYQENDLVPSMDVIENIHVGNERVNKFSFIQKQKMVEETLKEMEDLGLSLDINRKIEDLSVSDQQFVKILKALIEEPRYLILDEPTSMFNVQDAHKVVDLTKKIARRGIGVAYISHFLEEVLDIADCITVLRDGAAVKYWDTTEETVTTSDLTRYMVGRPLENFYHKTQSDQGGVVFKVEALTIMEGAPLISFAVKSGEVLGVAGMVGSGRTEIMQAVTGATECHNKRVYMHGKEVIIKNPRQSIQAGIAFITEDRQQLGLMLNQSILENSTIVGMWKRVKGFFTQIKKHPSLIQPIMDKLRIKAPSVWSDAGTLSGGNQQKVVLAKWLYGGGDVFIFDEPTRGIDIHAKFEFYDYITELTKQGKAVIMVSSDMAELISLSDRVLVVKDGAIASELVGNNITEERVIIEALGVSSV